MTDYRPASEVARIAARLIADHHIDPRRGAARGTGGAAPARPRRERKPHLDPMSLYHHADYLDEQADRAADAMERRRWAEERRDREDIADARRYRDADDDWDEGER